MFEWNKISCFDCGWFEDYKVPYDNKKGDTRGRKLSSYIKQIFGLRMAEEKKKNKISKSDLKHIPIELDDFDTGEYTEEQAKFLKNRYEEIIDTPHVEFDEKDKSIIHFLVMQELKVKKLYRKEAMEEKKTFDSSFSKLKKDEINVLKKLEDKVDAVVEEQKSSQQEMSLLEEVEREFDDGSIQDLIDTFEERRKAREEKVKRSQKRKQKMSKSDYSVEEELQEIEKEYLDDE